MALCILHSHLLCVRVPAAPRPHQHLGLSFFWSFSHPDWCEEVYHYAFKLYFPNNGSFGSNHHIHPLGLKKEMSTGKRQVLAEVAPLLGGIPRSPTQQLLITYHWPDLVTRPSLHARKTEKCIFILFVCLFLSACITTSVKPGVSK